MNVFTNAEQVTGIDRTAVALGNFDGVHLGHAELLRRTVAYAREHGLTPAVFTFSNPPINAITGRTIVCAVATQADKAAMLERLGVECLFSFEFDARFHAMPPQAFIEDLLLGAFRAQAVFCGFNFRFGAEAAGDPDLLRAAGEEKGFAVDVMDPFRIDGTLVSSTVIRDLIADGSVEEAARYLGRPFEISGEIDRGNGIGRGLGFPTANLVPPQELIVPAHGVYVTESVIGDVKTMRSVTNVGFRPTVGDHRLLAETHIFGVPDEDLYGRWLRVRFLSMIRPEHKFADMEQLKRQVERDKEAAFGFDPG
jgi:riboflavin kinase/FMN adenylyltransferase